MAPGTARPEDVPRLAGALPVKQAYAAYHDGGFEVIGIALDRSADRQKLIDFTVNHDPPCAAELLL